MRGSIELCIVELTRVDWIEKLQTDRRTEMKMVYPYKQSSRKYDNGIIKNDISVKKKKNYQQIPGERMVL